MRDDEIAEEGVIATEGQLPSARLYHLTRRRRFASADDIGVDASVNAGAIADDAAAAAEHERAAGRVDRNAAGGELDAAQIDVLVDMDGLTGRGELRLASGDPKAVDAAHAIAPGCGRPRGGAGAL